ncbi:MAG: peroxidase-related enzyme [Candidatus Thermoplasmatota archaeon]
MPWIPSVKPEDATGALKQEYARIAEARGAVGDIFSVTGLHPGVPSAHLALYQELHFGEGPLSRRERELIATVVSRENKCGYCITHHADAFGRHAPEPGLQMLVATDYTKAKLAPRERAIADHAVLLTRNPGGVTEKDAEKLRAAGLDDRSILDVTLLTAYFNFVNRVATGLGLTPQDVRGAYRY